MRMTLMEELETKDAKAAVSREAPAKPSTIAVPEGVAPYLDKFYFVPCVVGADGPNLAALTRFASRAGSSTGSDWPSWKDP